MAISCFLSFGSKAFETNGRHWESMPIPYYINPSNCPVLDSGESIYDIIQAAWKNWSDVPCALVDASFMGYTDATWESDGKNTIFCVDHDWSYTPKAAGATLWIPTEPGQPNEVDLALNAADFTWRMGGADATITDVIDPVAVVTHELGHWLGLGHSADPFATMYYAYLPNGIGSTLAADDEAGICTLYPSGAVMCNTQDDCDDGYSCIEIEQVPVCQQPHDGPGAPCSKDYINCDGMCWVSFFECSQLCFFTKIDYSDGYCAPLCNDSECPDGFICQYFSQADVNICVTGQSEQDAGIDGVDGADGQDGSGAFEGADMADREQVPDILTDGDQESYGNEDNRDQGEQDAGADVLSADGSGCGCDQSQPQSTPVIWLFEILACLVLQKSSP